MVAKRRLSGQSARPILARACSPAIRQAPIAPHARGFWLDRGRKARGAGGRPGQRRRQLPAIAVPQIPVDEEERPLPPPEPLARNALVDGPILRTLLWLALPNVMPRRAGNCGVIAATSHIGA